MANLQNLLKPALSPETRSEELARTKRYNEAAQKRKAEKLLRGKVEKLKKATQVGGLKVEA